MGQNKLSRSLKLVIGALLGVLCAPALAPAQLEPDDQFTFVRIKYNMGNLGYGFQIRYGRYDSWRVDYPTAEENFLRAVRRGTSIPVAERAKAFWITDDELFEYPFAYVVEVGYMELRPEEAEAMREWLLRGGFLFIDDFHGPVEWQNFETEIAKVFPNRPIVDIPPDHPIFHCFYDFDYFPQVPGLGSVLRGTTYEKGGRVPHCRGIFDDHGRLMVLINHNIDLGDSWEHAADYDYPREYSLLGYQLGINYLIYAMTH